MNRVKKLICVSLVAGVGCTGQVTEVGQAVAVKGKLSLAGQPLTGVAISLQPLEDGHMTMLDVNSDGTLTGEVTPGKYAYFISPPKDKKGNGLAKVPSKYQQPDLARTLVVSPGDELQISLD